MVDEEFVDRGESAKTANRPELAKMLRYLDEHPVHYVIVHKVDRLARNRADDVAITLEHPEKRRRPGLLLGEHRRDAERPAAARHHELDRRVLQPQPRKRSHQGPGAEGQDRRHGAQGTGRLPPRAPHRERLSRCALWRSTPSAPPLVKWAFEAYATGEWTLPQLLEELTARGLTTRPGPHTPARVRFSLSGLHQMLTNPYYIGVVLYRGRTTPASMSRW